MSFAPQQNWDEYHSRIDPIRIEKERSLSPLQKLRQYAEMFDSVWSLRDQNQNEFFDLGEDNKLIPRKGLLAACRLVPGLSCD